MASVDRRQFFGNGSILEVTTDPAHAVIAGMPERASIFFDSSPAFTTLEGFQGAALAKYAPAGSPLLSGYLLGEERLHGHAAALDVRHGNGHVLLIGFRPQWRGQPFGTFRVLFNAALFGGDAARGVSGTPGFWTAHSNDPPTCPNCGADMRILAFITAAEPVDAILSHLGLPTSPPPLSPARGPPQHDLGFDADPGFDFDQTPAYDLSEPEPVPDFDLDQSAGA